ncbi:MAG: NAD-dependent epimerase/dehydratase family protein [Nevskiaceae bacterium]|nr:MAG: NAD-dependent epimerase/dehydratase family protein [Nevskiaceae bacterium]TBR74857.1 MAG: NAD-dependent epimerase/dehydratase family protein [Nevskiaceae bacterium]
MLGVVGGSGFIGTRLCEGLKAKEQPFCIVDKRMSEFFADDTRVADVRDAEGLSAALAYCDAIVNLAAEHHDDVRPISLYDEVNVGGARNVCAAAEKLGIGRIVFTSSVAVYGFAPADTGEEGAIHPFNDYGRTKTEAETVYRAWQQAAPDQRSLVIVRPTVVFGERNRGNVYNLLRQIASGKFVMIGAGRNRKSMAYVGNVVAFLQHMLTMPAGVHVCNYVDKPDMDMNQLVALCNESMGKQQGVGLRLPYAAGYAVGAAFDAMAWVTHKHFPVSRIRVKKFCATTQFASAAQSFGFNPPFTLQEGLSRTLQFEFHGAPVEGPVFYSE